MTRNNSYKNINHLINFFYVAFPLTSIPEMISYTRHTQLQQPLRNWIVRTP